MDKLTIERQTLEDIANAVRNKNHESNLMSPSQIVTAIDNLEVEDDYEWRKPEDWPDLESIELPGSWDTNTVYFLFDKKCGIDTVWIYCYTGAGSCNVYKGTVINGEFIGDLMPATSFHSYTFTDILTDEYTVYKIVGKMEMLKFATESRINNSYAWCDQGCVWIYGEIPKFNGIGGDSSTSFLTPYLKRLNLSHVQTMYPTFPENFFGREAEGYDISVSYVCGKDEPNDWANLPMNRTGNGPITPPIKQKSDYIVKHINFQNTYTRAAVTARNVVLVEPSGKWRNQQYQNCPLIEKFVVQGGTLKCLSMYYQFYNCSNLEICDLSGIDFSETTNSGNAFTYCCSLKTLILNPTWTMELDLRQSPLLTRKTIIDIFNILPIISNSKAIKLNSTAKYNAKLTAEEIAIATNKGWTVT